MSLGPGDRALHVAPPTLSVSSLRTTSHQEMVLGGTVPVPRRVLFLYKKRAYFSRFSSDYYHFDKLSSDWMNLGSQGAGERRIRVHFWQPGVTRTVREQDSQETGPPFCGLGMSWELRKSREQGAWVWLPPSWALRLLKALGA